MAENPRIIVHDARTDIAENQSLKFWLNNLEKAEESLDVLKTEYLRSVKSSQGQSERNMKKIICGMLMSVNLVGNASAFEFDTNNDVLKVVFGLQTVLNEMLGKQRYD